MSNYSPNLHLTAKTNKKSNEMYEARLKMLTTFIQRSIFVSQLQKHGDSANYEISISPQSSTLLNSFCNVQTGIGSGHV